MMARGGGVAVPYDRSVNDGRGLRMKGVVFSLLEQIVVRDYGEDTWDDLLDEAGRLSRSS